MKFNLGNFQAGRTTILPVFVGQSAFGLQVKDYHGKKKDHPVFFNQDGTRFIVAGMGEAAKFNLNKFRDVVAQGVRAANKEGETSIALVLPTGTAFSNEQLARVAAESVLLGTYRFDKYKAKKEDKTVEEITVVAVEGDLTGLEDALNTGRIYGEGTNIARDLKNEPSNKMRPYDLVDYVQNLFKGTEATVEVFKGDDLVKNKFNGLLAVGGGSAHAPAMIQVTYATDKSKPLTALVGKGLTFDTGGISLKAGVRDLSNMRMDMGGAAAVTGALYILTRLQAKANIVMLIPTCENAINGDALLPGSIIEYANGTTVQVSNTDAEGRLVLADALLLADKLGAARVADIATLTGACAAALGSKYAGVWGYEQAIADVKVAAETTGEKVWEMPLAEEYEEALYSAYADMKNIGDGPLAGAITAALFLKRFIGENQQWVHVDMAGPMETTRTGTFSSEGATGYGARLLAEWALQQ